MQAVRFTELAGLAFHAGGRHSPEPAGKLILIVLSAKWVVIIGLAIRGFERADSLLCSTRSRTPPRRARRCQATSLPFIIIATIVGQQHGVMSHLSGAELIPGRSRSCRAPWRLVRVRRLHPRGTAR